jgi:hypothetical protein
VAASRDGLFQSALSGIAKGSAARTSLWSFLFFFDDLRVQNDCKNILFFFDDFRV